MGHGFFRRAARIRGTRRTRPAPVLTPRARVSDAVIKARPRPEAARWQAGLDDFDDTEWAALPDRRRRNRVSRTCPPPIEEYRPLCHQYVDIDPIRQIYMELGCAFIGGTLCDEDHDEARAGP